ncbi:uracil-DNA glycosylase [Breoghania sp. L-A4]|nr:uracil-DNA glycosylase [Breoghania sp. L-A4]AXS40248.1 uracil-DNA glycosylase [Breoghania sp. L-A4]
MPETAMPQTDPGRDCPLCPRLVAFREELRAAEPAWFNAPVRTFGSLEAKLLIIGLAPGVRGANRTGRPFTGDYAGDLLYQTLDRFGLSRGHFQARPDDGLELVDVAITNAVRCVPPQNKPVGAEIKACRPFLVNTINAMQNLRAILVLGRIAHDTLLSTLQRRRASYPFTHGGEHDLDGVRLFDSYHCSRYNTNTGVLTEAMFEAVFARIKQHLG